MRLHNHPMGITHPCHTYTWCLTTYMCNGWAYGSIITQFTLQVQDQIWKISRNPGSLCCGTNRTVTQKMRLYTHPKWITHPCHTHTWCLTTFICNGWAYGSIITQFTLQVQDPIWKISRNPGSLLWNKLYCYTEDEASYPPKVDHTSMSYIYMVFDNLHMQWMGIWIHHQSLFTAGARPDLENQQKSWVIAVEQTVLLHRR
jgi:hypothetical protein